MHDIGVHRGADVAFAVKCLAVLGHRRPPDLVDCHQCCHQRPHVSVRNPRVCLLETAGLFNKEKILAGDAAFASVNTATFPSPQG